MKYINIWHKLLINIFPKKKNIQFTRISCSWPWKNAIFFTDHVKIKQTTFLKTCTLPSWVQHWKSFMYWQFFGRSSWEITQRIINVRTNKGRIINSWMYAKLRNKKLRLVFETQIAVGGTWNNWHTCLETREWVICILIFLLHSSLWENLNTWSDYI